MHPWDWVWILGLGGLTVYELVQFFRGGYTLTRFLNNYVLPHRPGIYALAALFTWGTYHLFLDLGTIDPAVDPWVAAGGGLLLGELGLRVRRWLRYRKERATIERLFREIDTRRSDHEG